MEKYLPLSVDCNTRFQNISLLQDHIKAVHKKKEVFCDNNLENLSEISEVKENIISVEVKKKALKIYECTSHIGALKAHISAVHEKKKPYKCDLCDKTFSQKPNRDSHLVAHIHQKKREALFIEGENSYQCNPCHKNFSSKKSLKFHNIRHVTPVILPLFNTKKYQLRRYFLVVLVFCLFMK